MAVPSKYSNVIVKNETEDYDGDFEIQNDNSSDDTGECDKNNLKLKKETVKNEEQEIEISEFKLQTSCYSPYHSFERKEDSLNENLDIYKVKTESHHDGLCINVDQSVGEFPEHCDVDEKVAISKVNLLSTEYKHYEILKFDIEDEKPRIFETKQSSSDHLQQEEEMSSDSKKLIISEIHTCKICSYQATNETVLNMHIASVHNSHEGKIKINCDFCGKPFSKITTLDDHVLKKHKDGINSLKSEIYTCTICSYQTTSKFNLNKHIDLIHNEQKIEIRCEFCDNSFSTNRIRDDHILKNHKDKISLIKSKIYSCIICPYQTTFNCYLNRHLNRHNNIIHNEQKINCDFCDKSFSTNKIRDDHILKNHKDKISLVKSKIYSCIICPYQTKSNFYLNRHIKLIHNKQKINCDKSFSRKRISGIHVLKKHNNKTKSLKSKIQTCTICSYQTISKSNLNKHINSIHNEQKIKIRCELCDKSFRTNRIRDDHILKNHKEKIGLIKSKIYSCFICHYQTTLDCYLNRHNNLIHKQQKIDCDVCEKVFSKKIIRDEHVLRNHKEKISLIKSKVYTCTICLFQTTFKPKFNSHFDLIHNKQKINCDFCDKSFSKKIIRDDHVLNNHKDKINLKISKIHSCTICSFQTTFKYKLTMHIDSVHNEQKTNCDFCEKAFSTKRIRDEHVLKNHKDKINSIKSKIHACTICPYQTTSVFDLNSHINLIHNKQKIHCDFCDKSFSKKTIRDDHILNIHKDKISILKSRIYSCTICPYQTTMNCYLNRHNNSIHNKQKINCDFCDKSFSRKRIRDEHVLKNHKDKISSLKSKIYSCNICSFQTTSNYFLNSHINSIHKKQKINCDFCYMSFSKKVIRDDHVIKNHKDNISSIKGKIHTCTICSFQTTIKSKLSRHVDSIHKKQKINCDFCDISFSKKIIRDDHVIKNHKDNISSIKGKIHTCTICSFQTTIKSKLNRHIDSIHMETKNKL